PRLRAARHQDGIMGVSSYLHKKVSTTQPFATRPLRGCRSLSAEQYVLQGVKLCRQNNPGKIAMTNAQNLKTKNPCQARNLRGVYDNCNTSVAPKTKIRYEPYLGD
ncbi:MAG: hypothetical protein OXD33_11175, partial [Rhodobacteraceae bacterium]|nr:hypothetical protein [Paracoccaceae bacterium]